MSVKKGKIFRNKRHQELYNKFTKQTELYFIGLSKKSDSLLAYCDGEKIFLNSLKNKEETPFFPRVILNIQNNKKYENKNEENDFVYKKIKKISENLGKYKIGSESYEDFAVDFKTEFLENMLLSFKNRGGIQKGGYDNYYEDSAIITKERYQTLSNYFNQKTNFQNFVDCLPNDNFNEMDWENLESKLKNI